VARSSGRQWRRAANPAAFSFSLAAVLALAYLALTRASEPSGSNGPVEVAGALIEFDRFSARRERSGEADQLSVSFRLRAASTEPLRGFAFVVARNDHVAPHAWAIWPPQARGLAISSGGHFHGATPTAGESFTLTDSWERLTAVLPHNPSHPPFDTVVVYFVSPQGQVLLSRPFGL
jgi:hypothetical protein